MKIIEDIGFLYTINDSGDLIITNKMEVIDINDFDECAFCGFMEGYKKCLNSGSDFLPLSIDSYGGEVHILLGMLNYLDDWKKEEKKVITFTSTKAMSCGAVLLSAGTKGYRYMAPHAHLMIHEVSGMEFGKLADVKSGVKHQEELNKIIFAELDRNCDKETGYFQSLAKENKNADLFLSAQDCLKHGIIDKIGIPTIKISTNIEYQFIDTE
jgi:ATP-dependent Clp protease protease subunit